MNVHDEKYLDINRISKMLNSNFQLPCYLQNTNKNVTNIKHPRGVTTCPACRAGHGPMQLHWAPRHGVWEGCSFFSIYSASSIFRPGATERHSIISSKIYTFYSGKKLFRLAFKLFCG